MYLLTLSSLLVLCASYPTTYYPELDEATQLWQDEAPSEIQEAAYINPFQKRAAKIENNGVYQEEVYQPFTEDDDNEWEDATDEDATASSSPQLEELEEAPGSVHLDGVERCNLTNHVEYNMAIDENETEERAKYQAVKIYLCKFGYLTGNKNMTEALKDFQRFVKLQPTGIADESTFRLMQLPRCGDRDNRLSVSDRQKRWANSGKIWKDKKLKYYIAQYTRDMPRGLQRNEIQRALEVWGKVAPIDFKQVHRYKRGIDIILSFQYYYHRDDYSFDGRGGELAHAFLPEAGVIHFDDSEYWTTNQSYGISLYSVAAHEIGHSLGLEHTSKRGAIMSPFYDNFAVQKTINPDDIVSIQNLYGSRGKALQYHCPNYVRWDTAFSDVGSGNSFAFYEEQVWKFDENGLMDNFPKLIINVFYGFQGRTLDASLSFKNGKSMLFSGDEYWRYNATTGLPDDGYPKSIELWGLEKGAKINDVIRWPRNNYVYFFTNDVYYRYNSAVGKMDEGYPQPLYLWQGVPTNMDGAMTSIDGSYTFFFLYHYYFPFNNRKAKVEQDQIQQIKYSFFLCQEDVKDDDADDARFLKRTIEETSENMNEENWLTFQKLEIENSAHSSSSTLRPSALWALWPLLLLLFRYHGDTLKCNHGDTLPCHRVYR